MWLPVIQLAFLATGCFQLVSSYPAQSKKTCQLCKPGYYVIKDCTDGINTMCAPCGPGTFTDKDNDLPFCSPCSKCGKGNNPINSCTTTRDTMCFEVVAPLRIKRQNDLGDNADPVNDRANEPSPTTKTDENVRTPEADGNALTPTAEEPSSKVDPKAEPTPKAEQPTHKQEESTPKAEETTAKAEETTAKAEETTTKAGETTAKPEETTAKAGEVIAKAEETTAKAKETTAKAEEVVAKADETNAKPEEATAKAEESTTNPEETITKAEELALEADDPNSKPEEVGPTSQPNQSTIKEEPATSTQTNHLDGLAGESPKETAIPVAVSLSTLTTEATLFEETTNTPNDEEPLIQAVKMAPTQGNEKTTTLPAEQTVNDATEPTTEQIDNSVELVQTTPDSKSEDTTEEVINTTESQVTPVPKVEATEKSFDTTEQVVKTTEANVLITEKDQTTPVAIALVTSAPRVLTEAATESIDTDIPSTSTAPATTDKTTPESVGTTVDEKEADVLVFQNIELREDNKTTATTTIQSPSKDGANDYTTPQDDSIVRVAALTSSPSQSTPGQELTTTTAAPRNENMNSTKNASVGAPVGLILRSSDLSKPSAADNSTSLLGETAPEVNGDDNTNSTTPVQIVETTTEEVVVEQDNPEDTKVEEVHIPSIGNESTSTSTERIKTLEELEALEEEAGKEEGSGEVDQAHKDPLDNYTAAHGNDDDEEPHTAKAHSDTEEDRQNKQRTAIIVGTAVGSVAFFTLAFFTSRHCKKKRDVAITKRPPPKKENGDYELAPLTGSHPSIFVDMENRNPNGLYRHGPKMGPPSPRMFRKNEGKFAFPETNNEQASVEVPPLTTFSPSPQESVDEPLLRSVADKIKYIDESTDDELDSDPRDQLLPPDNDLDPCSDPTEGVSPDSTPEAIPSAEVKTETDSKMSAITHSDSNSNGVVGNHEIAA